MGRSVASPTRALCPQTQQSEGVDLDAGFHGNWIQQNARARLNRFFQKEEMTSELMYSYVGRDHKRSEVHGVVTPQPTANFKENIYCHGAAGQT